MRVLTQGTRLADRYTLIRRLGAGGMSEVWLARDGRAEQCVALKFLAAELAVNSSRRTLFHQEWRVASRLMHAHIARVFEYHDEPDGPCYSHQFIDGPNAGALANEPPADALRPIGLIADALRYAHAKGIVHGDIKAGNILLDARGLPYLIDFGVASGPRRPAAGGGAGSPVAASPQQRAGAEAHPADDIFALGVLIHETLSGSPPPRDAEGGAEVAPLASRHGVPVPPDLQRLLRDMLATDPQRRPSAEEVTNRLRDAGIAPGPARLRGLAPESPESLDDTEIAAENLRAIRPVRPRAVPGPGAADVTATRGVPPKVAWTGLAVLALAVVAVIFWLPDAVDSNGSRRDGATEQQRSGDEVAPTGDEDVVPAADTAAPDPAEEAELKAATDEALGQLLSRLERLQARGIEQWGGQTYLNATDVYEQGDRAYLNKDYSLAGDRYRQAAGMLEPFFDRVDKVFDDTLRAARAAFANGDPAEAVKLYELAVAITPDHAEAEQGLLRARNLSSVLTLMDQGRRFENDLELRAAKLAFEKALELDPEWQPAASALERVTAAIRQRSFEQLMTEGLEALASGNLPSARAAFDAAKALKPQSQEPLDGLLRVDQEIRLANIQRLEAEALALEENEEWQAAIGKYEEIRDIDPDLQFVHEGLSRARQRAAIHEKLRTFIGNPDSLSAPATMQAATQLLLQVTTMSPTGPRLEDQKNELSRLLKRAATPLKVQLVSDNATEVSIFRVGNLGTFSTQELSLPPGAYVATGSRVGFRDVRLEFRVAPELDLEPIVIKCEEQI